VEKNNIKLFLVFVSLKEPELIHQFSCYHFYCTYMLQSIPVIAIIVTLQALFATFFVTIPPFSPEKKRRSFKKWSKSTKKQLD